MKRLGVGWLGVAASVVALGCGEESGGRNTGSVGVNTVSASADGTAGSGGVDDSATSAGEASGSPGSGGESASPDDDDDGPVFDVATMPEGSTGEETTACAKVDILYVIDNSPSMVEEQQTLIANFATFVADMQTALVNVESYHVGVITTDDYINGGGFDDGADTVNAQVPACQSLGGLVVQAQAGNCQPFAGGGNFITDADDLPTKFECIANVGEDGDSDELVGDALRTMMGSQFINNAVSECNAGFIREDALLVIVILTDENDSSSSNPGEWYQSVVAAKGVPENAVVLSLIWEDSAPGCSSVFSETNGTDIIAFTEMFPNHSVGNICDNSYAGFFSGTLPLIETACQEFDPEG